MYYADRIGLANVLADVKRFHAQHGFWWKPAPLLERLAHAGLGFADLRITAP
jgi:3-hydroxyacyl-CoA dehydrogenase